MRKFLGFFLLFLSGHVADMLTTWVALNLYTGMHETSPVAVVLIGLGWPYMVAGKVLASALCAGAMFALPGVLNHRVPRTMLTAFYLAAGWVPAAHNLYLILWH